MSSRSNIEWTLPLPTAKIFSANFPAVSILPKFCAIRYIVAGHGSLPSSLYTQNVSGICILQYMHYQFRGLNCIGTHCPDLITCTTELCMSLVGCIKPITFSSHHHKITWLVSHIITIIIQYCTLHVCRDGSVYTGRSIRLNPSILFRCKHTLLIQLAFVKQWLC